jgi:UDP-N-acetylglucosamine diphosphorylase/glucosamine-1-phosphate N-acetyltransferase
MQVCFFEDYLNTRFYPLTLTRPVDDLRLGILTIAEKWQHILKPTTVSSVTQTRLRAPFSHSNVDEASSSLWINSRYLPSEPIANRVKDLNKNTCIKRGNIIIAAHADAATTAAWMKNGQPDVQSLLVLEDGDFQCITHLWDLFLMNEQEISADFKRLGTPSSTDNTISPHAILENKKQIFIGRDAVIEPGAILVASRGPIYIGEGAVVMAGALIQGPAAICRNSTVKMDAKIYQGTTVGPACKVSGEINNSILHSYSNKSHDGYIGNSLIGQWCNLGSDTNTSNLKNNYSNICITDWQSQEKIESGQQFMGTVMGDHTKTAINTQLNTGTL